MKNSNSEQTCTDCEKKGILVQEYAQTLYLLCYMRKGTSFDDLNYQDSVPTLLNQ